MLAAGTYSWLPRATLVFVVVIKVFFHWAEEHQSRSLGLLCLITATERKKGQLGSLRPKAYNFVYFIKLLVRLKVKLLIGCQKTSIMPNSDSNADN